MLSVLLPLLSGDLTNVKAFSTNVATMIGNAFIGDTIHNPPGYVFGGNVYQG